MDTAESGHGSLIRQVGLRPTRAGIERPGCSFIYPQRFSRV